METFEVCTRIPAPADAVWQRVTTPAGINDELMPVMRMTVPVSMRGKTLADVAPGSHLGRSWLLLFGLVPFDYDDIGIAELGPDRRFVERSSMLSMRRWEHERTVTPRGDDCELRDRIAFEPRAPIAIIPGVSRALRVLLRRLVRHRHTRAARYFALHRATSP